MKPQRLDEESGLPVHATLRLHPSAAAVPDAALAAAVSAWQLRLRGAGIACRAVAIHSGTPSQNLAFPDDLPELTARWNQLVGLISEAEPVRTVRPISPDNPDMLLACALQMSDGKSGVAGVAIASPHNDQTVQLVLLALGRLQLSLMAARVERAQRATDLLELLAHVASSAKARAGAQDWINRTASLVRAQAGPDLQPFTLMLFDIRADRPRWWVTADAAWTEQASAPQQVAAEVAAQVLHTQQPVQLPDAWAAPAWADGEVVAVLVALYARPTSPGLPSSVTEVLKSSLALCEPLLRHWRQSEQALWRHGLDSVRQVWRRLFGAGYWTWKAAAFSGALVLVLLLALPVTDQVTANATLEGRQRLIVSAATEGFIGQVHVRPGQVVQQGQLLARLDDRDLKLEQARYRGEREQAAGRLRQAMTDHEAPAAAQAQAEIQQAEAQLALVEAKLARTALTAPQAGLVVAGDWVQQMGSPVEAGKEMFEIAAGDAFRVALHVPDRDMARVKAGQRGHLRLTGQPHAVHDISITGLTAVASVQEGTNGFRVEADWQDATTGLSPGMQGVAKIDVGSTNLLVQWTRSTLDWLVLKWWSWW